MADISCLKYRLTNTCVYNMIQVHSILESTREQRLPNLDFGKDLLWYGERGVKI